jgi:hypothetical protein
MHVVVYGCALGIASLELHLHHVCAMIIQFLLGSETIFPFDENEHKMSVF